MKPVTFSSDFSFLNDFDPSLGTAARLEAMEDGLAQSSDEALPTMAQKDDAFTVLAVIQEEVHDRLLEMSEDSFRKSNVKRKFAWKESEVRAILEVCGFSGGRATLSMTEACESLAQWAYKDDMFHVPEVRPSKILAWREGIANFDLMKSDSPQKAGKLLENLLADQPLVRLLKWSNSLRSTAEETEPDVKPLVPQYGKMADENGKTSGGS